MITIAIINQKGGVGKSTTAQAIGTALALKGCRVLFVDLDGQGNLSYTMDADAQGYNAMGVLVQPETIHEHIQQTNWANIDILASSPTLAGADAVITQMGKENRLKAALERISGSYDYCIIDTPPALGILTVNALTAATGCVVPAQADIFSVQGIIQLHSTIQTVKQHVNKHLSFMGILLTRFNERTIISQQAAHLIHQTAETLGTITYTHRIRECTAIKEAQAMKESILTYAPRSNATADYKGFMNELEKQITELKG